MRLPRLSSPVSHALIPAFAGAAAYAPAQDGVLPQAAICTPCVQIGGGRWCFTLPIIGRKCINVPSAGRWKACCRVRFGWPPVSCGISRC